MVNVAPNDPDTSSDHADGFGGLSSDYDVALGIKVTIGFSDDNPGDTLSRIDVRWRIGTGSWTELDSVAYTTGASPNVNYYTFAAHAFNAHVDENIEWQARVYDQDAAASGWSDSDFFTPRTAPTAATFDPVPTSIVSNAPTLTFDTASGMFGYELALFEADGSTPVAGISTFSTTPAAPLTATDALPDFGYVNGTDYQIGVRWQLDPGVWSPWALSGAITAAIEAPLAPTVVLTPSDDTASVHIDITNPGGDSFPPDHNDVYRTNLDDGGPRMRIATGVAVNGSYTDFTPASRATYRYRVTAVNATASTSSG